LESRFGKKDKVKGEIEVSFKFTANQAPLKLTIQNAGEAASVLWEKDKSVHAIVAAACQKRGWDFEKLQIVDGTTKLPVDDPNLSLGELWTTDIILEPKKAKKKNRDLRKSAKRIPNTIKRQALDGWLYGIILRGKGFSSKDSVGIKCIIGPVSSSVSI